MEVCLYAGEARQMGRASIAAADELT